MPEYLTDDAICLRITDFSETSQIAALFTRRHGLVRVIAKGAKRPGKKKTMSGPLDLLTSGQAVWIAPREQRVSDASATHLATLAEWDLMDHRRGLRGDLQSLNAAMLATEATTHLVQPNDPHEPLFIELSAALELLENPQRRARVLVAYLKSLLIETGYFPRLGACAACGKPISEAPMRFSPVAGGVFCKNDCGKGNAGSTLEVPGRILLALERLLAATALRDAAERSADPAALHIAAQILAAQIESVADKPLRTASWLGPIFKSQP